MIIISLMLWSCQDKERKTVVCWGDSLTAPSYNQSSMKGKLKRLLMGDSSYPGVLAELLGDDYEVVNCGVGGENTLTIMARQGAYPMKTAHEVTIYEEEKSKYKTYIGNKDMAAFVTTYNGKAVTPLLRGYEEETAARVNPCRIGGEEYCLSSESTFWHDEEGFVFEYNYFIGGDGAEKTYTIPEGTVVETEAMRDLRGKYAYVFFMGQNGGFASAGELISQIEAMVDYSGGDKYVVVSFHKPNGAMPTIKRMGEMEDSLEAAFGPHFLNLRRYMTGSALSDASLTATREDRDSIAHGQVPPQLMTDGCHFTKQGYRLIARQVAEKFRQLGY